MIAHRNVRSLSIDLKSEAGLDIIRKLVAGADIVIENFRPGTMDRLGLGYEELRKIRPGLIFCSLSGYGADGPYLKKPGQDLLIQSLSGLVRATGRADSPPTPVGSSIIDQHGAVVAAMGILAALHKRDRTGEGTKVESSLLGAALDLQMEPLSYHMNGYAGERSKSGISSMFYKPPYGVFATSDGYLCLSTTPMAKLASAFDDEWFLANEYATYADREKVNTRIAEHLTQNTCEYWLPLLSKHDVWVAPVNSYDDVLKDPQIQHNDPFVTIDHPKAGKVKVVGHPVLYDGQRPGVRSVPPGIGQDTHAVLSSLGFSSDDIDALASKGVVNVGS